MSVPFPPGIPRVEGPGLGEECVGVGGSYTGVAFLVNWYFILP